MAWFIAHSLVAIVLSAALGFLVGWLWWGRQWSSTAPQQRSAPRSQTSSLAPSLAPSLASRAVSDELQAPAAAESPVRTETSESSGVDPFDPFDVAAMETSLEAEPEDPQPADDLQRIEGIGPRIAAALQNAEIRTFETLAVADAEQISQALRTAGLSFAPSASTWPDQAAMLMEGDEVGLTALKHRLVPERDHATAGGTPAEGIAADDLEPETEGEYQRSDDEAAAEAGPSGTGIVSTPEEPAEDPAEEDPDDDLERIEGVGPRIAAALHAADLNSYRHIAAAEPATLQAALEAAGLRFAPSLPTWPRQAILLADGDTEGHARLTASLVSGSDADRKS